LSRVIFVTGTDTGVGKTLLTALLLRHLRESGVDALAMKPFCSGGTADVELIQALQQSALPDDLVNPFYFKAPLAPLVALRRRRQKIRLVETLAAIRRVARRCKCLVIEGSGGVLVPLGDGFNVADVISRLRCETVVVAGNKLGTINHTLLAVEALRARGVRGIRIVLMDQKSPDLSAAFNAEIIRELAAPAEVFSMPYVGNNAMRLTAVCAAQKKFKKTLARILDFATVSLRSLEGAESSAPKKPLQQKTLLTAGAGKSKALPVTRE